MACMTAISCHFSHLPSWHQNPSSSSTTNSWSHSNSVRSSALQSPPSLLQKKKELECKTIEEVHEKTRKELKRWDSNPMEAMQLIDSLQWLGIGYHYEEEIDFWLQKLQEFDAGEDLNGTALRFRLLRQNAKPVSCDVFEKFTVDHKRKEFRKSLSQDELEGVLNLYEASYLGTNDEDILSEAMKFSGTQFKLSVGNSTLPGHISRRVRRALELPRHLRMEKLESRLHIEEYGMEINHSSLLLQHAKLDYNNAQLLYQMEFAEIKRWWNEVMKDNNMLNFGKNPIQESFLWSVGVLPDPNYSGVRINMAKTIAILIVIDDIFDSYGCTVNELSLFTLAIQKWDLNAIEELPEFMKICYGVLYDTTNEIAQKILNQHGRNVHPFLAKVWIHTIEAYMIEAKWFNNGQVQPNLEEYTENAITTSGTYMILVHLFFMMGQGLTTQNIKLMAKPYPKLFSTSGRILRLWDDIGTSKEEEIRGDNASSIPLLMKEKNLSFEHEAREYMKQFISNLWKDLNMNLLGSNTLPLPVIKACFNLCRTSQVIYQHQEESYLCNVNNVTNFILSDPKIGN